MSSIINYLKTKKYKTVPETYYQSISNWYDWYQNGVDSFHHTTFFNGINEVSRDIKKLGMAKSVCETWANLLLNEKVEILTGDDGSDEKLDEILKANKFKLNANRLVEQAFALGTGAFVEYLHKGEVMIDYVTADMIYPLSWGTRGIEECAFGSRVHTKEGNCIQLQIHTREKNGNYVIENKLVLDDDELGFKELELPNGIEPIWRTKSDVPMFQIIMPNIVNNVDRKCPLGVSVYANALDILKEIDTAFDALNIEIETGRRMVFLSSELFFTDKNGVMRNVIGQKENVLRFIGDVDNIDNKKIQDFTPSLRIGELTSALQLQLTMLSQKVGMGVDQFAFNGNSTKTATEIISENSDMYQTMKKHELVLEDALINLVKAIATLDGGINVDNVSVNFDDSIIEDTNAIKSQAITEYQSGLIDPIEYYQKVYGMDEEQAIEYRKKLEERQPKPNAEEMAEYYGA